MLYKSNIKEVVLDSLKERLSGITDSIIVLLEEGYIPNRNKNNILNWASILIDSYENIDVLSAEQQEAVDRIFNKVIKL